MRNSCLSERIMNDMRDVDGMRVQGLDAAIGTATAADGTRSADVADPWPSATADAAAVS